MNTRIWSIERYPGIRGMRGMRSSICLLRIGEPRSHACRLACLVSLSHTHTLSLFVRPISRQRWLHCERKWRRCNDPVAIVEKSCKVVPITATMNWNDRYGENAKRRNELHPVYLGAHARQEGSECGVM